MLGSFRYEKIVVSVVDFTHHYQPKTMHYRFDAAFDPSKMDKPSRKTHMTNGTTAIFQLASFGSVIFSCQPLGPLLKVQLLVGYICKIPINSKELRE